MSDLPPISLPDAESGPSGTAGAAAPVLPKQIGPYRVVEQVGTGGMGIVLRARRADLKQDVAIKLIKLGMDTQEVLARFESERQALAVLNHPNVARVFDAGQTETGRPYFVMEFVPGVPITEFCDKSGLPIADRLALFKQACHAVQHAHQKGIIHRDLKPSNILVTLPDAADDQSGPTARAPLVKVIDFGVAKATTARLADHTLFTERGQLLGTPEYMSPEQAEMGALDIDTRTDIYALGVVLYELLSGARPFESRTLRGVSYDEMRRVIREVSPPKPSTRLDGLAGQHGELVAQQRKSSVKLLREQLRRELEWIPLKALRKDRTERYRTAAELADDLDNYLNNRPLIAAPESRLYTVRKTIRRHRGSIAVAATILALLVGGVSVSTWQTIRANRNLRFAIEQQTRAAAAERVATDRLALVERRLRDTRVLMDQLGTVYERLVRVPGTIPAKQLLAKFTAEFLDALFKEGPEGLDERLLKDVGAAYQRLGDMQGAFYTSGSVGDLRGSRDSYLKSVELLERVSAREPSSDVDRLLSVSLERCGDLAAEERAPELALKNYTAAAELRERIVRLNRDNWSDLRNRAVIHQKLARARRDLGSLDAAIEAGTEAVRGYRDVIARTPKEPRHQLELAAALHGLASVCEARNEKAAAVEAFTEGMRLADRYDATLRMKDFESQRTLALCLVGVGYYEIDDGRMQSGLDRYDRAGALLRRAVASEPENYTAKLAHRQMLTFLGEELERLGATSVQLTDGQRAGIWDRCQSIYDELFVLIEDIDRIAPMKDKDQALKRLNEWRDRWQAIAQPGRAGTTAPVTSPSTAP